jgi:hypothetical protein
LLSTTDHFAFAPTGAVVSGYTTADLSTYTSNLGYGWSSAAGMKLVQRASSNPLHQDFAQGPTGGSTRTFLVDLDPGTYNFTFHLGDQSRAHTGVQLSVNGTTLASNISTRAGRFSDRTYTVTVTGSQASVTLKAASTSTFALDGLDIVPYFNATLTAPTSQAVNTPGTFQVAVSGASSPSWTYDFNYMDGTPIQEAVVSSTSYSASYSYAVKGQYPVQARVTDSAGHFETLYATATVTGTSSFYISPTGSDYNDGSQTRPWATTDAVNNHYQFEPGDQILFQGGATFVGSLYLTNATLAGTASNPVTISSYGTGHAVLNTTTTGTYDNGIGIADAGGVLIQSLDLVGPYSPSNPAPNPSYQSGINFYTTAGQTLSYAHVDDVKISGFGGFAIQVYAGSSNNSVWEDVSITNCTISGNYGSGIYIYSEFGQTYQIQNVYIGHVTVTENLAIPNVEYPGFPLYLQNVQNGVVERCFSSHNDLTGTSTVGGSGGIVAAESVNLLVQYNEISRNFTNSPYYLDTAGIDFDGGVLNSIMQYNYTHDNDGAGILLCDGISNSAVTNGNVIRYNTSENDVRRNAYGSISMTLNANDNVDIYNNTVYLSPSTTGKVQGAFSIQDDSVPEHVHVRNNIFITTGGVPLLNVTNTGTDLLFQGNDYWSSGSPLVINWLGTSYTGLDGTSGWRTATEQEKIGTTLVGLNVDPHLVAAGQASVSGNPDQLHTELAGYCLAAGSSLSRAGLNLASYGVSWDSNNFAGNTFLANYFSTTPADLFGHSLAGRTTFSMGLDEEGS